MILDFLRPAKLSYTIFGCQDCAAFMTALCDTFRFAHACLEIWCRGVSVPLLNMPCVALRLRPGATLCSVQQTGYRRVRFFSLANLT